MDPNFKTTHWTMIRRIGLESGESRQALNELCQDYWYPLFAYARKQSLSPAKAEDAVQAFYLHLIESSLLKHADSERGKFRSFLLTCFKNFLLNQVTSQHAKKRGGNQQVLSLDIDSGEQKYSLEPNHDLTPDRLFLRSWAESILEAALTDLDDHYAAKNQQTYCEALKHGLTGATSEQIAQWATDFDRPPGTIRVGLSRMRKKFRSFLENRIASTLELDEEQPERLIEDEINELFRALER